MIKLSERIRLSRADRPDEWSMDDYSREAKKLEDRIAELEEERPSVENGKNRYGVDVSYFRNVINRELNRSLQDFKPDELARVFARLSVTADPCVIFESEFKLKGARQ